MTIEFTPKGVCSRRMLVEVEDGVVKSLQVPGGCHGNLQGISKLVDGINCNGKGTSCPDQLAQALKQVV